MPGYTFHLISHTHWDREWYLPDSAFLPRLIPAVDDLLHHLESQPDSKFLLDGQTILLEDYLRVRSEEEARVRALVAAGRLQVGPWYVLGDEFIPSAESLIRNLLVGKFDADRLGRRSDVLYSPDAFGHPAVWPTLAAEFGIRYGVIWRGLGGEPGQERDLYRWRGFDGREVLLYHLPRDGYEVGASLVADPERLGTTWPLVRAELVPRASSRQVPVFIGADHHFAHPEITQLRALLAELEPSSEFRISRLEDFFTAAAAEAASVPVIEGELRWSYGYTWTLQGVHGTRAPLKRRHALTEMALIGIAEPLAALALARRGVDRRPVLRHAWRTLLQSEFHDSIAGCTADPVARRVELRLDDAGQLASAVARGSLDDLIGNDPDRSRDERGSSTPQLVLWNPVPRRRDGVIVADLTWFRRDVLVGPPGNRVPRTGAGRRPFALIGSEGESAVQAMGHRTGQERLDANRHYPDQDEVDVTRVAFRAPRLGGFGLATLRLGERVPPPAGDGVWLRRRSMGNEFIEVEIAPTGALHLLDRRNGQRYRGLLSLESSGDVGDTYSYCAPVSDRLDRTLGPVQLRALATGPLVAAFEIRWELSAGRGARGGRGAVGVRSIVSLYAGSPVVRCTFEIENRALDHRLRLRAPTGLDAQSAVAGGQFGVVERASLLIDPRRYPRETPVATAPAHRYVSAAAGSRGLAIFTPGFFEYELEEGGDLLVTVLRAIGELSRGRLPTRPGHAGWPVATPLAQCQGLDRFQLGIGPITEEELKSGAALAELWEDLFLPLQAVWLRQASPLSPPRLDVRLDGERLVFSGLKPAEQGRDLVLRCYNPTGSPTAGAWLFDSAVRAAHRARADESELHEIRLGDGGRTVPFHAAAHEVVTIVVSLGSSD